MTRAPLAGLLVLLVACGASREGATTTATHTRTPMEISVGGGGAYSVALVRDDDVTTGWIHADVADAWRHLVGAYGVVGFQAGDLAEYIPDARRVTVSKQRVRRLADRRPSTYLDCGYSLTSSKADQGTLRILLSTWLEPSNGGTMISTRFEATAHDTGTRTAVPCASNGRLEQLIADQLLARVILDKPAG